MSQGSEVLSPKQQEAVTVAWELGYYNVPAEATIEDVAEELDVTHQAVSQKLRRAHRNAIRRFVLGEEVGPESGGVGE